MKVVEGFRFASVAFAAALASCATAEAPGPMLEGSRWQVIAIDGQVTPRTDLSPAGVQGWARERTVRLQSVQR